ncbi:cell division protein FtsL [Utexia brackfieldae]|uniref:cell division protein FtsL n=1 Tax=Utexia brackfieldae TaxID=3074108 RepID=UPI00370D6E83
MNVKKQRSHSLIYHILEDLFQHYKLPLFLVVLIIISASAVLVVTQKTRLLINEREQLLLERNVLENEWRNLTLEENVLADQKRIERQAINQLKMQYVTGKTETVIVLKKKS